MATLAKEGPKDIILDQAGFIKTIILRSFFTQWTVALVKQNRPIFNLWIGLEDQNSQSLTRNAAMEVIVLEN